MAISTFSTFPGFFLGFHPLFFLKCCFGIFFPSIFCARNTAKHPDGIPLSLRNSDRHILGGSPCAPHVLAHIDAARPPHALAHMCMRTRACMHACRHTCVSRRGFTEMEWLHYPGIPKGQYKGYTCPQCTRAKVSAQHHRQREKKSKATVAAKKEKASKAAASAAAAGGGDDVSV